MNFFATPEFVSTASSVFTCFEIPINLFGAYCILFKTPNSMKSVKWAILNLHLWSSLMDFSWSVLTRFTVLLPAFSGTTNGLLLKLGVDPIVQLYFIICLYAIVSVSIVAVYENRYFILFSQNTYWKSCRWPFLAINISLVVIFFIPLLYENPSSEVAIQYFQKEFPEIPFTLYQKGLFAVKFDRSFVQCSLFFYGILLIAEVFVFSFSLYRNLKKCSSGVKVSSRTYEMQKKFLIAVVLQVHSVQNTRLI
ncbi:hypothetical protein CAEBREN_09487 [Caenorhabditis brenneri]|uniref:Serpentine receptor class gamma n=1 Tax=Caenorhabditis brenneri TaxID=135651 RepID=G0M980_CAEBE|nr:hypothetical protein CAEBREN_09487 [Caenorhabditis brenneri]